MRSNRTGLVFCELLAAVVVLGLLCLASVVVADQTLFSGKTTRTVAPALELPAVANEITVDVSGGGQFSSITQALAYVDAIHATNASLYVNMHVVAGRYDESPVFKGYIVVRGDVRRTRIYGNTVVGPGPVYFDGFDFRTTNGSTPVTFDGTVGKSVLGNCYILNDFTRDAPNYGVVMTNSSNYVQIFNSEIYVRNNSATENAKAVCVMAGSGGFELVNMRLKTSSASGYASDNEYLGWFFGDASIQIECCQYQVLHDTNGMIYMGDVTTGVEWMDSASMNNEHPTNFLNVYGNGAGNIRFFCKEMGVLKVRGSVAYTSETGGQELNVFSGPTNLTVAAAGVTNTVPMSKISESNTVYSFWIGYEGEYKAETNATGGAVSGRMYFIRKP